MDNLTSEQKSRVIASVSKRLAGKLRAPAKRRRTRPFLETLERRATPATYTWIGLQGGLWDDPSNWLSGQVPKSGAVDIDFHATVAQQTITLESDDVNFEVSSLTVESGSYTLIGPHAGANQPFSLSSGVALSMNNGASLSFCTPFSMGGAGADSLELVFGGIATEAGTGTVAINNQHNLYANGNGLTPFAVDAGTVALGSGTEMDASFFAIASGATLLVPSGSEPTIGSLSGSGIVQMGDLAGGANATSLFINTPRGRTDTFDGDFVPGPAAVGQVSGGTIQMNGPGSLTVGSIDPLSQGQFQVEVAGGSLDVADMANAQTLNVAPQATFGGPGTSRFSGPASFADNSTLSVALDGTGAGQFTLLSDTDSVVPPPAVEVGGADLSLSVGYSPTAGDTFTVITAPNGTIAGQFANAPDRSTITPVNSPVPFLVTYNEGPTGRVASLTLTAMAMATTTSVALDPSSTDPSMYDQNVTFDARVAVSGGGPVTPTGTVLFYDGNPAAGGTPIGISQALTMGKASVTTAGLSVSTHLIYAVYTPSSINFTGSTSRPLSQTVISATPTIAWASPAPITYGTALGPAQLDATASVPGSFAYSPAAGTVLKAGNNQTLSVTFTPTDNTDYTTASATTTIGVNKAAPSITWASPAPIAYGAALSSVQLDASSSWTVGGVSGSVPGTFTYSPAAGTVLRLGNNQTLSVTFAPMDSSDYTIVSATTRITVVPATTVVALASSSADPSAYGQRVTFEAAVATIDCGSTAISGTVAFYDGKPGAGGIEIGPPQGVTGGHASIATATLSAGVHAIYAVYSPDPSTGAGAVSTSASLSQKVTAASALVSITLVPPGGGGDPFYTVVARVTTNVPGLVPIGTISYRAGHGRPQNRALSNGTAILERTRSRPINQTFLVTFQGDRNVLATSPAQIEL